jgi:cation diffusion facilitator CzcD-associated flavoprotein CzcO
MFFLKSFKTFNHSNVHLVTESIDGFTANGIRNNGGQEYKADIIILATGFNILASPNGFQAILCQFH